jgi:hypothetical protein
MGGMKNAYNLPVGEPEVNRAFGTRKLRRDICINVDLKEI